MSSQRRPGAHTSKENAVKPLACSIGCNLQDNYLKVACSLQFLFGLQHRVQLPEEVNRAIEDECRSGAPSRGRSSSAADSTRKGRRPGVTFAKERGARPVPVVEVTAAIYSFNEVAVLYVIGVGL